MDYDTAVKVSAGFGGGMYLGGACGAVTGAIMAIGLKHGGAGPASRETAALVQQFAERFKALHHSVDCPDLTGFDLGALDLRNPETMRKLLADRSTPEGQQAATEVFGGRDPKEVFAACAGYVRDATTIAAEIVGGPSRDRQPAATLPVGN